MKDGLELLGAVLGLVMLVMLGVNSCDCSKKTCLHGRPRMVDDECICVEKPQ